MLEYITLPASYRRGYPQTRIEDDRVVVCEGKTIYQSEVDGLAFVVSPNGECYHFLGIDGCVTEFYLDGWDTIITRRFSVVGQSLEAFHGFSESGSQ